MNILVVLAHNDDEFFIVPRLRNEIASGNQVIVVYLTYGSVYGASFESRIAESSKVLRRIGVRQQSILLIGLETDIFDGLLPGLAEKAYVAMEKSLRMTTINQILVPAWEGGHPDHDASHLIGVAFGRSQNLSNHIREFPAYNGSKCRFGLFRVMDFPDRAPGTTTARMSFHEGVWAVRQAFTYKTQRRTFLGLLPGATVEYILHRRFRFRKVPLERNYFSRPHTGELFYEKRFSLTFEDFKQQVNTFISSRLESSRP